ncbi:MAG TPA: hypothetical protein VFW73_05870 [Lacipirellulaceae bacterium]|nr:hypothetical protein [Lacipirellulaceae bacterium]
MRQIELLAFTIAGLNRLALDYAIVGSYASSAWGEPRMTRDIDIVIRLRPDQVHSLCSLFPNDEFYVSPAAAAEAVRHLSQFNVIHPASGNKIDFMIAGHGDWPSSQLARHRKINFGANVSGHVASPEDVILGKLIYYREGGSEKHLRDISGIVKIMGNALDREYIARMAESLGVAEIWNSLCADIGGN